MAGTGRADATPAPELRLLGTAIARAAESELGLAVTVRGIATDTATLADLPERLEERALLSLIEAPGERLGLAVLSPGLVAALIEMQTTGALAPADPAVRRPTRTDAALCAPWIARLLAETDAAAAGSDAAGADWEPGFRYASAVEDARLLPLLLDDARYRLLQGSLALGSEGRRQGTLLLILPEPRRRPPPAGAAPSGDAADWSARLSEAVLPGAAEISAILARVSRPLAEVLALEPGSVLRLPAGSLSQVRLEGWGRRLLGLARLGQYRGYLAVRLTGNEPMAAEGAEFDPARSAAFGSAADDGRGERAASG